MKENSEEYWIISNKWMDSEIQKLQTQIDTLDLTYSPIVYELCTTKLSLLKTIKQKLTTQQTIYTEDQLMNVYEYGSNASLGVSKTNPIQSFK